MTWGDLKAVINKMSDADLEKWVYIHEIATGANGYLEKVNKQKFDLWGCGETGETLASKTEWKKHGCVDEDFDGDTYRDVLSLEIPKGAIVLEF